MKVIGLIGGLSWQSTISYYRLINDGVGRALGGHHCADLRIHSGDFDPVHEAQDRGDHPWIGRTLAAAGAGLVAQGAEILVIASNTCHRYAEEIEAGAGAPVLHIVDATAVAIEAQGLDEVLLLGTDYTMSGTHYRRRMERLGVVTVVPDADERAEVHRIIFDELVHGDVRPSSKDALLTIVSAATGGRVGGVILGCTELGLILDQADIELPVFDSTQIHCDAAVAAALA